MENRDQQNGLKSSTKEIVANLLAKDNEADSNYESE